jgi:hypothetical protein
MMPQGIAVPGRAKPMQPLTGVARDRKANVRSSDLIDSATYVHNADSYAWFSRRMMKDLQPVDFQKFKQA